MIFILNKILTSVLLVKPSENLSIANTTIIIISIFNIAQYKIQIISNTRGIIHARIKKNTYKSNIKVSIMIDSSKQIVKALVDNA